MTEILVVGFPKSGNTWLSRLLSDALGWPVRGINGARPLAECGDDHAEGHVIRQLHLYPSACGDSYGAIPSQYTYNTNKYHIEHRIIHILRDPRDVAVSINHYWGIKNLQRTITDVMDNGAHPLWGCGWIKYIDAWRRASVPVIETRYEWLHADPVLELQRLLDRMGLHSTQSLGEVVTRQQIDAKRAAIRGDESENYAHGKGAQLCNLRTGRVGDWKAEFDSENIIAFAERFTDQLIELGYETDRDWALVGVQTC